METLDSCPDILKGHFSADEPMMFTLAVIPNEWELCSELPNASESKQRMYRTPDDWLVLLEDVHGDESLNFIADFESPHDWQQDDSRSSE